MTDTLRHAMLDLETLGTAPGAVILTIGIVEFDPNTVNDDGWESSLRRLKINVDLQSCLSAGLKINPGTLKWWLEQDEQARRDAFSLDCQAVDLSCACASAAEFLTSIDRIWAHGANFDPPILAHAMTAVGVALPWHYRAIRDTRTILEAAGLRHEGRAHEPIFDCIEQARVVSSALNAIAGRV